MIKTIRKILIILSMAFILINATPPLTHATNFAPSTIVKPNLLPGPSVDQINETGQRAILIQSVLPKMAIRLIGLISAAALIFVIIGGVRYLTAYGDEEKINNAKSQVIYAIIGFVIAIMAYTIVTIIINLRFEGSDSGAAQGPALPPEQIQQNP